VLEEGGVLGGEVTRPLLEQELQRVLVVGRDLEVAIDSLREGMSATSAHKAKRE